MELKCSVISRQIQTETLKVPRPANAFMLYANENRKKMAQQFPLDSNKEISKRLGNSWKLLDPDEKNKYFILAKQVDAEHKRKYPDYVYNPKEARLRKAMREANRERALGVAMQQHSPRGGRRSQQPWSMNEEDQQQLMMTPSHGMRGVIASPMHCGTSPFPLPAPGGNQFMHPMQSFPKNMHIMSHNSSIHGTSSFLQKNLFQPNPIAQLQHQADLWQQYQPEPMRPTPPEVPPPYLMPTEMSPYSQPPPEIVPPDVGSSMEKTVKINPEGFGDGGDAPTPTQHQHPHVNENVPPVGAATSDGAHDKMPPNETSFENKVVVDNVQPMIEQRNMQHSDSFLPSNYSENVMMSNPFEKGDDLKMKKENDLSSPVFLQSSFFPNNVNPQGPAFKLPTVHPSNVNPFVPNNQQEEDYHKEYIRKFFESSDCETLEIIISNNDTVSSFNYVTYPQTWMNTYEYSTGTEVNDLILMENYERQQQQQLSKVIENNNSNVSSTGNVLDLTVKNEGPSSGIKETV